MAENNKNNEEGIGSSNDQEASSASSVNEDRNDNGNKRIRDDDKIEEPVPRKKAKIIWTNALHSRFLQAISHLGLDKAVPKRILEFMNVHGLTRENVASHLQKYRLFLKKVAERGLWTSQAMSERILRSSFATGYNPSLILNKNTLNLPPFPCHTLPTTFHPGHSGNFGFPNHNHEASTSTTPPPQFRPNSQPNSLLGGQSQTHSQLPFGYQQNRIGFGNGNGVPMPMNGFPRTPLSMFQNQSVRPNFGNPLPNNFQFGSSANYAALNGNANRHFPAFNANTNYAGMRLNENGELGAGQMQPIRSGMPTAPNLSYGLANWPSPSPYPSYGSTNWVNPNPNPSYGSTNWVNPNPTDNANTTAFTGNGLLSSYANVPTSGNTLGGQGGASSSNSTLFGTDANQIPMPFNVPNQETNVNNNIGNNSGGNDDFVFDMLNDFSNHGTSSEDEPVVLDECDLALFFGSANPTDPLFQPQDGEGAEININDFLNVEFSNSCTLLDKIPWHEQTSHEVQRVEGTGNANVGSSGTGNTMESYFPSFDQTPSSTGQPVNSDLNGIAQPTGTSNDNQEWDEEEDLLSILLGNNPYNNDGQL